ncbi:MAG: hypothetical protein CVT59_06345 [Actinobacteria bacterium HGW-Actinobacteria-1]|jgi:predicted RNA-binding protein Jag|nr:MAG: hypothetical protein CVT59_06345 [Actinobacteria bacterium HGW-Actinobacteria-1]
MGIVAMVLLIALLAAPAIVFAQPSAIDAKQAEKDAAIAAADALQKKLTAQITAYIDIAKRLEVARAEVTEAGLRVIESEADLERSKASLEQRIGQIYRGSSVNALEMLFTASSVQELLDRMNYLVIIGRYDNRLVEEMRIAKQQAAWEQQSLEERAARLTDMQADADAQRVQIEAAIDEQQAKIAALDADIAELVRASTSFAPDGDFSPNTVISDANFRDVDSMSEEDVQRFLDAQSGTLATYTALDHAGVRKSAAAMIVDAARQWRISPKVILATLQKEQSLISDPTPSQNALDWAMGCGKADTHTDYKYQGFGNQIWGGAQVLDKNTAPWHEGIQMTIDGTPVFPSNASTYSLFKYTPHLRGTTSFWMLYWRYFGDPLG